MISRFAYDKAIIVILGVFVVSKACLILIGKCDVLRSQIPPNMIVTCGYVAFTVVVLRTLFALSIVESKYKFRQSTQHWSLCVFLVFMCRTGENWKRFQL